MKTYLNKAPLHPSSYVRILRRPSGRNNNPLIEFFYYTQEPENPWRCDVCVTKAQHTRSLITPSPVVNYLPAGFPKCCRKCGLDYVR